MDRAHRALGSSTAAILAGLLNRRRARQLTARPIVDLGTSIAQLDRV
jgi:hypothetical protein